MGNLHLEIAQMLRGALILIVDREQLIRSALQVPQMFAGSVGLRLQVSQMVGHALVVAVVILQPFTVAIGLHLEDCADAPRRAHFDR